MEIKSLKELQDLGFESTLKGDDEKMQYWFDKGETLSVRYYNNDETVARVWLDEGFMTSYICGVKKSEDKLMVCNWGSMKGEVFQVVEIMKNGNYACRLVGDKANDRYYEYAPYQLELTKEGFKYVK